jgi:catechol 2,3-dioxygenase-like lactoylglutathione lyase family enzyme
MTEKPKPTSGLRHVALMVKRFSECVDFYTRLLGMTVDWHPDEDNIYLSSGCDNLALHRAPKDFSEGTQQHLDHIGFVIDELEQVDVWYRFFRQQEVPVKTAPITHRDGARSFYCQDPDGNTIQLIYHPSLAKRNSRD